MSHTVRKGFALLAAMLVLFGTLATSTAYAGLDDEPTEGLHAASKSNPGAGEDYWWRQGWGRTTEPDFMFFPPDAMDYKVDGYITRMHYSVDRLISATGTSTEAQSTIDMSLPHYSGVFGNTTNNTGPYGTVPENTVDMWRIVENPPLGFWPPNDPDAASLVEGQWYMYYRFESSKRLSTNVHGIAFGIDTTPPRPVTGLTLRTGLYSPPVTTWQPRTGVHISWDPAQYDDLSEVGYYEVLIDDRPVVPESTSTPTPKLGRVYSAPWLPMPSSITLEKMPPGKHKVSIVCVDRATNRSVAASADYYSDPDTPTVSFTAPTNGLIKSSQYITADASDSAGAPTVQFALDGETTATVLSPPYRFKPNLTWVAPGAHVLSATATDKLGRSVTTTLAVSTNAAVIPPSQGLIVTDDEAFNVPMTGTTLTNPNDPASSDFFWRQGWGNDEHPQFTVAVPSVEPVNFGFVTGLLYTLNRVPGSTIDPSKPASYYPSWSPSGTSFSGTVDLLGYYVDAAPEGGWPASGLGGETQPYEGLWYFNFLPYTTMAYVPQNTYQVAFGIDVTNPRPVTNLFASPSLDASQSGRWTSSSRAHVTWDADRYDDLSGVAYYQVLVDDKTVMPDGTSTTGGRIYEVFGRTPTAVTIENMPPGRHKVSIIAVDRATNESLASSTDFLSDPDVPKVAFLTPTASILQVKPSMTATASDLGGVRNVIYKLDGVTLGTTTAAPYALTPDLSGFAAGTHVLSATATDMLGRTTTVSKTITLDKTPVAVSGFSRNYGLFYPIKRDNYYDNLTVKYTLNKAATVTLYIRDAAGNTRKTLSGARSAGANSFVWDGKWASDGKAHTGTFYLHIVAVDSAAYTSTTAKVSTVIRNYELVKTGRNTVKVISR